MNAESLRRSSIGAIGHNSPPNSHDAAVDILRARVARLNQLLEKGHALEAIYLANFIHWSDSDLKPFNKANFNPAELRDDRRRWTKDGAGSESSIHEVQYRGHFHNLVVDDLIAGLNQSGGTAIANVQVFGINGVLAIPDGASRPKGWNIPYFIEVKTGFDPPFTENQQNVYPLICLGGHAVSTDPRIAQLGLTPGELLPPMDIMVVHTLGPGQPMTFFNYCEEIGLRR